MIIGRRSCHGASAAEQDVGTEPLRAEPDAAGSDHRQHGDRCLPPKSPQRTDVSHLPRHAEEHDDHQGMSAQVDCFQMTIVIQLFLPSILFYRPLIDTLWH